MPCYNGSRPFEYHDVFSDPIVEMHRKHLVEMFALGFKLAVKIEEEDKEQVRDQDRTTVKAG